MLLALLFLFTVLPIIEISLLVALGGSIGWPATLLIALGTGALGATLARAQGLATLARISRQLAAGEAPTDALVDGAMILFAGAVLITPGVLTDAVGFSLLLPPVRNLLKPLLAAGMRRYATRQATRGQAAWGFGDPPDARPSETDGVVDVEVIEIRTRDAK